MILVDHDEDPETDPILVDNPNIPDGFSTFEEGSETMTFPVLDHPSLDGTGALLYWDGSGAPSFGLAPAFTTLAVHRREATGDGGGLTTNLNGTPISASSGAVGPFDVFDIGPDGVRVFATPGHSNLRYDVVGDDTAGDNEAPDGFYLWGQIIGNVTSGGDAGLGGRTTINAAGQTIIFQNLSPEDPNPANSFDTMGGLAERTFFDPSRPFHEQVEAAFDAGSSQPFPVAVRDDVASSPPIVVTDEPGFFSQNDDSDNTAVPPTPRSASSSTAR